jgi:hypothetical protein
MGKSLEGRLRGSGASNALLAALRQEGLLNPGSLSGIAARALQGIGPDRQRPAVGRRGKGKTLARDRTAPGKEDAPHLQVLAAMALCYL